MLMLMNVAYNANLILGEPSKAAGLEKRRWEAFLGFDAGSPNNVDLSGCSLSYI